MVGRRVERRASRFVLRVGIGTRREQQPDPGGVRGVALDRVMQRGPAIRMAGMRIGPHPKQGRDDPPGRLVRPLVIARSTQRRGPG